MSSPSGNFSAFDPLIAKTLHAVSTSGSKEPMFIDCLDSDQKLSSRLVKVARVGQIGEANLAAEIASAVLVKGLGLEVAEHRMVGFAEPYLTGINLTLENLGSGRRLVTGWAVGAEVVTGFQPIESTGNYPKHLKADASVLYAFDLVSTHYDRLTDNPNCAVKDGRLFVYDFDQCFPEISEPSPLHEIREPWKVGVSDWRYGHLFRRWLQIAKLDSSAVASGFSRWSEEWLVSSLPKVPDEWQPTVNKIWALANEVGKNADKLVQQVEMSLA